MTQKYLQIFSEVCRQGSITRAAEKLYMAQPAVSHVIREMEEYANTGLIYLQDKWDNENLLFTSPFVFVNILQDLPYENASTLSIDEQ